MDKELNRDIVLKKAGFCEFERFGALKDKNLDNPLSPKNFEKGHWFYETVIKERSKMFNQFLEESKAQKLTGIEIAREWTKRIRTMYLNNTWRDFWAMFRDKEEKANKSGWATTPRPRGGSKKYEKTPDGITMAKLNRKKIAEQRSKGR